MPWYDTYISKDNGQCLNKAKWKYCYYWAAKIVGGKNGKVIGYKCNLFNKDKSGKPAEALKECNKKYGLRYEGLPLP